MFKSRRGGKSMDYKSVLEEQIRELQKVQDSNVKSGDPVAVCETAKTISELVVLANGM
jgi:glycine cleavage system H lipoate-binding protein